MGVGGERGDEQKREIPRCTVFLYGKVHRVVYGIMCGTVRFRAQCGMRYTVSSARYAISCARYTSSCSEPSTVLCTVSCTVYHVPHRVRCTVSSTVPCTVPCAVPCAVPYHIPGTHRMFFVMRFLCLILHRCNSWPQSGTPPGVRPAVAAFVSICRFFCRFLVFFFKFFPVSRKYVKK